MGSRSQIARTATLSVAVPVAVLLTVEFALRLFQPPALQYYRNVKLLHVYHPTYLVGLPPSVSLYVKHHAGLWEGQFTTNSLGYRASPEPDRTRPQLACLGDSIVMGFGVSDADTFCSRLNEIEISGQRYQAMNLGVDSFGSLGSAQRLEESLAKLNLKLALFFPSPNDFEMPEELRALGEVPDDDKESLREANPGGQTLFRIQFEATRISYALHALKLAFEQLRIRRVETAAGIREELRAAGLMARPDGRREDPGAYFTGAFYRSPKPPQCVNGRPVRLRHADHGDPGTFRTRYCPVPPLAGTVCLDREPDARSLKPLPTTTTSAYDRMIETTRARGVRLVVVLLPIENEVLQCTQNGKYSRNFDFALRVKAYFERRNVEVLDLRPYVMEMCGEPVPEARGLRPSRVEDYFIPMDGHFTVLGNRWAAEALRRELRRLKL